MNLSAPGAAFVRHHEGFVDHWYLDPVNVPTIGIGFTWASAGFRDWWGRNRPGEAFAKGAKMTKDEAEKALIFICATEYGKAVNTFLGKAVPQNVFDGMTSPVFNMGPGSLKWKWAAAVKAGDLKDGASRLRTTGTTANGKVLKGLVTRRREEAELLETGDYAIGTAVNDPLADGVLVRGERGAPVAELQTALAVLGHYSGKVDGIFGYGTEASVLAFQRAAWLNPDGAAGPATLAAIAGLSDKTWSDDTTRTHSEPPKSAAERVAEEHDILLKPYVPPGTVPAPNGVAGAIVAVVVAAGALLWTWVNGGWEWLMGLFS